MRETLEDHMRVVRRMCKALDRRPSAALRAALDRRCYQWTVAGLYETQVERDAAMARYDAYRPSVDETY